jgi:hypothetical protein
MSTCHAADGHWEPSIHLVIAPQIAAGRAPFARNGTVHWPLFTLQPGLLHAGTVATGARVYRSRAVAQHPDGKNRLPVCAGVVISLLYMYTAAELMPVAY